MGTESPLSSREPERTFCEVWQELGCWLDSTGSRRPTLDIEPVATKHKYTNLKPAYLGWYGKNYDWKTTLTRRIVSTLSFEMFELSIYIKESSQRKNWDTRN